MTAVLRWLFRSPLRLLAGGAALALTVTALAVVGSHVDQREPTRDAGPGSALGAPAAPAAPDATMPVGEPGAGGAPEAAEFRRVATAFVQTWLAAPDEAHHEWQARMAGLTTAQLAAGLAQTDSSQVPVATLSRPLRTVAAGEHGASYAARLSDGSGVLVEVVDDVDGPRVSDIAPGEP